MSDFGYSCAPSKQRYIDTVAAALGMVLPQCAHLEIQPDGTIRASARHDDETSYLTVLVTQSGAVHVISKCSIRLREGDHYSRAERNKFFDTCIDFLGHRPIPLPRISPEALERAKALIRAHHQRLLLPSATFPFCPEDAG